MHRRESRWRMSAEQQAVLTGALLGTIGGLILREIVAWWLAPWPR